MPSRLGILAIVVFWLVSTSWLVVREIVPRLRTGDPPAFFTDVTDEMGGTTIPWNIFHKGENKGFGFSHVKRLKDRHYDLYTELKPKNFKIMGGAFEIEKLTSRYRVDHAGRLQELEITGKIGSLLGELNGKVRGAAREGKLILRVKASLGSLELPSVELKPVDVSAQGSVLNTMHLLNKIPGLKDGQSWEVPQLNILEAIVPGQKMTTPRLHAEVSVADLEWQSKPVLCFRIDYREPGKKATAHTWVRYSDGLVLQQEAKHDGMDLVLIREVSK